jgi:hypothetical protein
MDSDITVVRGEDTTMYILSKHGEDVATLTLSHSLNGLVTVGVGTLQEVSSLLQKAISDQQ